MRIGLVGAGKQAAKHLEALLASEQVTLRVADIDASAARAFGNAHGLEWTTDVSGLLADPSLDAVVLCTPTDTHVELAEIALAAGKHVFCEKPLVDGAHRLAAEARRAQRHGAVGYVYRFVPALAQAKDLLSGTEETGASPVLGTVNAAHFRLGGRGSHKLWKHRRETGGGAINEMLAHMVDLAIWYFGPPRTVETLICELRCPRRLIAGVEYPVDAEDYVLVRMISRSGVEMLLQADLVTPSFSQLIEIQGDNGSLIASIQQEIPSRLFLLRSAAGFAAGYTALPSMESSPFEMQMNDFLDLVRNPDRSPRCSFDDAVHTMRALDMIRARADLK